MEEKTRSIKQIIFAQRVTVDDHFVEQALPTETVNQIDPFLLIHHWDTPLQGNLRPKEVGVAPHAHRGFSPVTFVYKGNIQHRDSFGNNAIVHEGGTQWMHAGRGITHSERPSKELADKGGKLEFVQFWVNTPAKYKMTTPFYLPLSKEETPKLVQDDVEITVVAGNYGGVQGPAKVLSPQIVLRVEAKANKELSLNLPENHNTIIYSLDGRLRIDDNIIMEKSLVWFNQGTEPIKVRIEEPTRFIMLSGEPIGEEVITYGPFVMNTQTEILEALRDSRMGKMGILIEEF